MKDTQTALALADQQSAIQPITPMGMLQIAVSQGADLDKLQKLMELQERWEANEARKAFVQAMAAFKGETIRILKDKENLQYKTAAGKASRYVSLGNLVGTVTPFLSKHGLSARWDIDQSAGIKVTCIVTHAMGHSESVYMLCPPDKSGAKNPIQEIKSSITYGKVCTFESICGLASTDGNLDDDGNSSPQKGGLTDEQFLPHQEAIQGARDMNELKAAFKRAYTMAVTVDDQKAFTNLYEARKKVMQ